MKTKILITTALSLLLSLPLFAKSHPASAMSPTNIGNVSSTEQSLRYKRPSKRGLSSGDPTQIGSTSRTGQSLRYKGPGLHKTRRHKKHRRTRRSSRRTSSR